ncbi:13270_t:CDS:2 [Rhizophagus irregularis]|nr:13270_t:CDS:2 [Rhizophagus irregularis]
MFKENAYQVLEGDSREHDRSSIIRDLRKRDRSRDSRERDRSRDSKERDRSSIIRDSREHDRSSIIRDLRKRDIGRSLIIRDSKSPKGYDSAASQSKPDQSRHNRTESPLEPEAGYYRYAQNVLENMDEEQYKNFHDEVVQILSGLDDTLQLDHTKK